jgi:predicted SAM-dependent methyltransferase
LRKAPQLLSNTPLRLHLASGFHAKPGWVNIDLIEGADLQLDLRQPLPFPDGSASQIYSEHFFEHLSYTGFADSLAREIETADSPSPALSLLRECRRVLAPGGRLDIVVPDAERTLHDYVARDPSLFGPWWGPSWCDTPMHRVNYVFRQGHEHQYAYDYETLSRVLEQEGFTEVRRRERDPELDYHNAVRSLFVCARKPVAAAASDGVPGSRQLAASHDAQSSEPLARAAGVR